MMPDKIVDIIADVAKQHDTRMLNVRFASGAKTALVCLAHFRAKFAHHLEDEAGSNG